MESTSRLRPVPEPGLAIRGTGEDDPPHTLLLAVPMAVVLSLPLWALLWAVASRLFG